ncbi:MAG: hypothetical protein RLZZ536_632, partial [Planctomycetota bacterium]
SGCRVFEGSKLRRICREGNRPQSLEVASLLKLVAGDVLFSEFAVLCRIGVRNEDADTIRQTNLNAGRSQSCLASLIDANWQE